MPTDNNTLFSEDEWLRYTRHIQLPQFGAEGQKKLKQARVLVVGAGGLGSPVLLYLAAAGVGHITIVDGDTVDLTNLQRQILFDTNQLGKAKAESAKEKLLALNPDITVIIETTFLSFSSADSLIREADLVIDCTDNFATRYLINDVCAHTQTPWLFASIYQFSGQCALFTPYKTASSACFRCLFPEKPKQGLADCNTAGVLGVLPGLLGTLQANEALKFLAGMDCALENTLLIVEALDLEFRKIQLNKNTDCPVCTSGSVEWRKSDYDLSDENHCALVENNAITPAQFSLYRNDPNYCLLDVRTVSERKSFHLGGAHIVLADLDKAPVNLDKSKTIICYCQSGVRSEKAMSYLKTQGYTVLHLAGGITHWLKYKSIQCD